MVHPDAVALRNLVHYDIETGKFTWLVSGQFTTLTTSTITGRITLYPIFVPPRINNQNKKPRIGVSGVKGVHRMAPNKWNYQWNAQTIVNGRKISFGYFKTIEEAAKAYENGMASLDPSKIVPVEKKAKAEIPKIEHTRLLTLLRYKPETGQFHRVRNHGIEDFPTGHAEKGGYHRVTVDGKR